MDYLKIVTTIQFIFNKQIKMAKLDYNAIKLKIATEKGSTNVIGAVMDKKAEEIVKKNKEELLKSFNEHVVSQEISAGPDGTNISNTLNGKGNLYGFIGFPVGREPIKEVSAYLNENIKLDSKSKIQGRDNKGQFKAGGNNLLFDYKVEVPSKPDLEKETPLPWEETKSWLYGIEKGIAGFTSYIYWKKAGRSTAGIQANDGKNANGRFNGSGKPIKLRDGKFNNVPYFSEIYNNFKKLFNKTNEI